MSLRNKIVLLFGLLAVVPMLALAAFSYSHAQGLLRATVHAQLYETAQAVAESLDRRAREIDGALGALAASVDSAPSPESLAKALEGALALEGNGGRGDAAPDALLRRAAFVELRDALGPIRMLSGASPEVSILCRSGQTSSILEFSRRVYAGGEAFRITAGFWTSTLVSGEGHSPSHAVLILDPSDGSMVYADECREGTVGIGALVPALELEKGLSSLEEGEPFSYKEEGEKRLGAVARTGNSSWVAVATAPPTPAAASLDRLVVTYWLFVLGLGVFTALAFSILLGRFTKSLRELTRAAEEIGVGELDPWLPVPTSGEIGQLTITFSRMLARIRQMMTQVDQNGRLAVVGQLSAYLAHEIRNPLSSIKLNLQRLKRWTDRGSIPSFCREPLEISLKEVERLNASVSGVLQLSRAQDSPKEVVSLHDLVGEAAELLASRFQRRRVELRLDLDAEADRVRGRPGQLKSVILNLMVNALEAQSDGGYLEVRTELAREPEVGGPVLALHFKDGGRGIPPEIRDRIFEPFFTTKAGGSGIGLAMAFQSVRENDGDLYLEPSISTAAGAEFVAVFPLAPVEEGATPKPLGEQPLLGRGTAAAAASPRWAATPRPTPGGSSGESGVPAHLMTPEGLEAVLALSPSDSEDVN